MFAGLVAKLMIELPHARILISHGRPIVAKVFRIRLVGLGGDPLSCCDNFSVVISCWLGIVGRLSVNRYTPPLSFSLTPLPRWKYAFSSKFFFHRHSDVGG